jgi:hypothetical protein
MSKFSFFRNKAIAWLNSRRDFDEGIALLEQAKFRPVVVRILKMQSRNGPIAEPRLKVLIQDLIKAWDVDEVEDTDTELGIVRGRVISDPAQGVAADTAPMAVAAAKLQSGDSSFPPVIASLVRSYSKMYKAREVLHRKLSDASEDTGRKSEEYRKKLVADMERITDTLEYLYPLYQSFTERGELPDLKEYTATMHRMLGKSEAAASADTPAEAVSDTPSEAPTKSALQTIRHHLATKLTRARNMLLYQQETRADKENPLPDCPRRVKYEAKVANLQKRIKEVEYQIAKFG